MECDRGNSFNSILNQLESYLVQNRKANCQPYNLKGNGYVFF